MNPGQNNTDVFKSGYVAIAGLPNAGKSTLMNRLLREKLAIVTPKPQTTRHRVLGILSDSGYQLILLDTPGLLKPRYLMQQRMMETSMNVLADADLILALVDLSAKDREPELLNQALGTIQVPKLLVFNKSDLSDPLPSDEEVRRLAEVFGCREGLCISAKTGDGVKNLITSILRYIPAGPPFYPPDQLSDEPERFFVAEIIREQIFMTYGAEIPYATGVHIADFREQEGRKDVIEAIITVERESQKAIMIGKDGKALKRLGIQARKGIEQLLERPVFLQLNVRVRKKWRKDPNVLRQMGFS
ncbi:GTPase Era [bacterium]|nr:GTPase Era [bacterium]